MVVWKGIFYITFLLSYAQIRDENAIKGKENEGGLAAHYVPRNALMKLVLVKVQSNAVIGMVKFRLLIGC